VRSVFPGTLFFDTIEKMSVIIDISLPVHPTMPIYPGNQQTSFDTIKKPSGSQLTTITIDSHAGTHIDAPVHAGLDGVIEAFPLETFYGPCRVIELFNTELIQAADLENEHIQSGERILFKTDNSLRGFNDFHESWTAVSTDAAEFLADKGVALVGIDWFGIKQKNAPDNRAHTALLEKNIPILEGIDLSNAEEGTYTLAALPIAYQGIDGAPVRAVLIKE
jgi:arylformamidase